VQAKASANSGGRVEGCGVHAQAHAQQHVVAEPPGSLDRLGSQRPRSFWLAGVVIGEAQQSV
jgi:hypothetical protein